MGTQTFRPGNRPVPCRPPIRGGGTLRDGCEVRYALCKVPPTTHGLVLSLRREQRGGEAPRELPTCLVTNFRADPPGAFLPERPCVDPFVLFRPVFESVPRPDSIARRWARAHRTRTSRSACRRAFMRRGVPRDAAVAFRGFFRGDRSVRGRVEQGTFEIEQQTPAGSGGQRQLSTGNRDDMIARARGEQDDQGRLVELDVT